MIITEGHIRVSNDHYIFATVDVLSVVKLVVETALLNLSASPDNFTVKIALGMVHACDFCSNLAQSFQVACMASNELQLSITPTHLIMHNSPSSYIHLVFAVFKCASHGSFVYAKRRLLIFFTTGHRYLLFLRNEQSRKKVIEDAIIIYVGRNHMKRMIGLG